VDTQNGHQTPAELLEKAASAAPAVSPHPSVAAVERYEAMARDIAAVVVAQARNSDNGSPEEDAAATEGKRAALMERLESCHRDVIRCLSL